jgi:hypothetical protein
MNEILSILGFAAIVGYCVYVAVRDITIWHKND